MPAGRWFSPVTRVDVVGCLWSAVDGMCILRSTSGEVQRGPTGVCVATETLVTVDCSIAVRADGNISCPSVEHVPARWEITVSAGTRCGGEAEGEVKGRVGAGVDDVQ